MIRDLSEINAELVRDLATAAGWQRVRVEQSETLGLLMVWGRGDGVEVKTNDAETFSTEPAVRAAVRARTLSALTVECPRCGEQSIERDPGGLTEAELDLAQVGQAVEATPVLVKLDGTVSGTVHQRRDAHYTVLLHDRDCEAAPANLDELARATWN